MTNFPCLLEGGLITPNRMKIKAHRSLAIERQQRMWAAPLVPLTHHHQLGVISPIFTSWSVIKIFLWTAAEMKNAVTFLEGKVPHIPLLENPSHPISHILIKRHLTETVVSEDIFPLNFIIPVLTNFLS